MKKYGRTNSLVQVIRHVVQSAYLKAGNRIKFNHFGNSNYRSKEVDEALKTLEISQIIGIGYRYDETFCRP